MQAHLTRGIFSSKLMINFRKEKAVHLYKTDCFFDWAPFSLQTIELRVFLRQHEQQGQS